MKIDEDKKEKTISLLVNFLDRFRIFDFMGKFENMEKEYPELIIFQPIKDMKNELSWFDVVKKCPKCGGQMYYYEMPLEDNTLYLCFTCDDCNHEVYAYSDEEMQEKFNELEDWSE